MEKPSERYHTMLLGTSWHVAEGFSGACRGRGLHGDTGVHGMRAWGVVTRGLDAPLRAGIPLTTDITFNHTTGHMAYSGLPLKASAGGGEWRSLNAIVPCIAACMCRSCVKCH